MTTAVPAARHAGQREPVRLLICAGGMAWRANRWVFGGQLAVTAATGLLPAASADLLRCVLDDIATSAGTAAVLPLVAGLAAAACLMASLTAAGRYLTAESGRVLERLALTDLYLAMDKLHGLRRIEDPQFQNTIALAQQSGAAGPAQVISAAFGLAQSALTLASFLVALAVLNPVAALILLAAAVPAYFAERSVVLHRMSALSGVSHAQRRQLFYASLLASNAAAKEIRLFGLGRFFTSKMLAELSLVQSSSRGLDRRQLRTDSALAVLSSAITCIGLWWAVDAASAGRLKVGDVSLFVAAMAAVAASLTGVITSAISSYQSLLLFGCYRQVLSEGPDLPISAQPAPVPALRQGIELEDVWFRYDREGPWALCGVSCFLPAGQTIALVGRNGAGKSTLVKLLCRLYDPDRGRILWDGVDLRDVDPNELRQRISVLFQDYMEYELSAADNVSVGDLACARETAIERAAREAGVHELIAGLPDGYQTLLSRAFYAAGADGESTSPGRTGVLLSGGQWQRVALARTLLRGGRDLMILDEPSSGLDADAERDIHRRLHGSGRGRTTVLISHRLNTVRDAGQIMVLADGMVIERGGHDQLIALGGTYARMFSHQAAGYASGGVQPANGGQSAGLDIEPVAAGGG